MNTPSTIQDLTDRQREIVGHISAYHIRNGYSPSVRDLSDLMGGISTNAVHGHIEACARKGLVSRHPKIARSLTVTERGSGLLATQKTRKA
jgi:SOS-response transcriptional repressor LexA